MTGIISKEEIKENNCFNQVSQVNKTKKFFFNFYQNQLEISMKSAECFICNRILYFSGIIYNDSGWYVHEIDNKQA